MRLFADDTGLNSFNKDLDHFSKDAHKKNIYKICSAVVLEMNQPYARTYFTLCHTKVKERFNSVDIKNIVIKQLSSVKKTWV